MVHLQEVPVTPARKEEKPSHATFQFLPSRDPSPGLVGDAPGQLVPLVHFGPPISTHRQAAAEDRVVALVEAVAWNSVSTGLVLYR